jgi:hypothetical protein
MPPPAPPRPLPAENFAHGEDLPLEYPVLAVDAAAALELSQERISTLRGLDRAEADSGLLGAFQLGGEGGPASPAAGEGGPAEGEGEQGGSTPGQLSAVDVAAGLARPAGAGARLLSRQFRLLVSGAQSPT